MEYLKKMKAIQESILQFFDEEEDKQDFSVNKELLKLFQQNQFDKQELKSILYMISKIVKNHHRTSFFFEKIKKIFNLLKNQIKETFSNIEIYYYFKKSKRIILLLINEDILTIDSDILESIIDEYGTFFYIELLKFYPDAEGVIVPENCEEKRLKGENDSYLCEMIRNDSIEDFIVYCTKESISLTSTINKSIYETNSFIERKTPTLIEYSAFFGSIQIFLTIY